MSPVEFGECHSKFAEEAVVRTLSNAFWKSRRMRLSDLYYRIVCKIVHEVGQVVFLLSGFSKSVVFCYVSLVLHEIAGKCVRAFY